MAKERDLEMKLIVNENYDTEEKLQNNDVEDKVYQSNPLKADLYSKLLAFKQSQKKFKMNDLIKDSLK